MKKIGLLLVALLLVGCVKSGDGSTDVGALTGELVLPVVCDDLQNDVARESCKAEIGNLSADFLMSDIVSYFDLGRCAKLPTPDRVSRCQEQIGSMGVKGPISEADRNAYRLALQERNAAQCDAIGAADLKTHCANQLQKAAKQMVLDDILTSGNANDCVQLTDADLLAQCREFFGLSESPGSVPTSVEVLPLPAEEVTE